MNSKYVLIYILSVFIASISQVLLKASANKVHDNVIREYVNRYVVAAYVIFVISTMLTIYAYKEVALKSGPVIESLGYIFILVLGNMFLKEKITKNKILGNILIILGIIIFIL